MYRVKYKTDKDGDIIMKVRKIKRYKIYLCNIILKKYYKKLYHIIYKIYNNRIYSRYYYRIKYINKKIYKKNKKHIIKNNKIKLNKNNTKYKRFYVYKKHIKK